MKTVLTFNSEGNKALFWNNVVNFKDVVGVVGKGSTVEVEVVPADVDKLPMRIRQIRSFATDCGVGIVE
tara:strand:- start:11593 stop:11799 length:207 start_codon:yes stop_codon:yes gene_type:complete